MLEKMKYDSPIIVYYKSCFLERGTGAHARMYSMLQYLATSYRNVILYTYDNPRLSQFAPQERWTQPNQDRFAREFPNVRLVVERWGEFTKFVGRARNLSVMVLPYVAPRLLQLKIPGVTPKFHQLREEYPDARFLVNYADGLTELNGIRPDRCIVETHDVKFGNFVKKRNVSVTSLRVMMKFRHEMACLNSVPDVIAITQNEQYFFSMVLGRAQVLHIPSYGTEAKILPIAPKPDTPKYDLLFVGSENQLNRIGFLDFVEANASWLSQYKIAVCGRVSGHSDVQQLAKKSSNIELLGFVEDLPQLYAESRACISPVDGTGLKIKVVEALAQRKPVFGSEHSIDGLPDGYQKCVFPLTQEMVAEILSSDKRLAAAEDEAASYASRLGGAGDLDVLTRILSSDATVR